MWPLLLFWILVLDFSFLCHWFQPLGPTLGEYVVVWKSVCPLPDFVFFMFVPLKCYCVHLLPDCSSLMPYFPAIFFGRTSCDQPPLYLDFGLPCFMIPDQFPLGLFYLWITVPLSFLSVGFLSWLLTWTVWCLLPLPPVTCELVPLSIKKIFNSKSVCVQHLGEILKPYQKWHGPVIKWLSQPPHPHLSHSSLENYYNSAILEGFPTWTAFFRSCQRISIGVWSGLWRGHFRLHFLLL